ncbi:uncharacterized protein LOC133358733 [Lethenteron reissneri]|uniref:uncharacterized protein LOC133358733 n=1 Tax=Lethenteron reissneri TaxID=7753 RepID=UPI002AB6C438|nr:uncharacterized protein LOC133358733 [Lethenteron reissneri]
MAALSVAGDLLTLPMPCGVENSAYTSSSASSTVSSPEVEPMSSSSSGAGGGGGTGSSGARSSMSVASSTSGASSHQADGAGDEESPTDGEPTEGLRVGSFLPGSLGTRDVEGNVVEVDSSVEVLLEAGGGSAGLYEVDNESPGLRAELVDNVACLPGSLLCPEAMEGTVAVAMVAVAGVPITSGPSACGDGESGPLLTGPMAV